MTQQYLDLEKMYRFMYKGSKSIAIGSGVTFGRDYVGSACERDLINVLDLLELPVR